MRNPLTPDKYTIEQFVFGEGSGRKMSRIIIGIIMAAIGASVAQVSATPNPFFLLQTGNQAHLATPGSITQFAQNDLQYNQQSGATTRQITDLFVALSPNLAPTAVNYQSSNSAVIDYSSGSAVYKSDGTVLVLITTAYGSQSAIVTAQTQSGQLFDEFIGYNSSSLAYNVSSSIDTRIAALTPSVPNPMTDPTTQGATQTAISVVESYPGGVYTQTNTWSATAFVADIDLSSRSSWPYTGALISPRHMLSCGHAYAAVETDLSSQTRYAYFTERATNVVHRVAVIRSVPVYADDAKGQETSDLVVLVLASDVPAAVPPAKVLPADFRSHLPSVARTATLPVVWINNFQNAFVTDWSTETANVNGARYDGTEWMFFPPVDAKRLSFYSPVVPGDSGSPVYMVIGAQPVLIGTWSLYYYDASGPLSASLPSIADNIGAINAAMAAGSNHAGLTAGETTHGSPYALTTASLNAWPSY